MAWIRTIEKDAATGLAAPSVRPGARARRQALSCHPDPGPQTSHLARLDGALHRGHALGPLAAQSCRPRNDRDRCFQEPMTASTEHRRTLTISGLRSPIIRRAEEIVSCGRSTTSGRLRSRPPQRAMLDFAVALTRDAWCDDRTTSRSAARRWLERRRHPRHRAGHGSLQLLQPPRRRARHRPRAGVASDGGSLPPPIDSDPHFPSVGHPTPLSPGRVQRHREATTPSSRLSLPLPFPSSLFLPFGAPMTSPSPRRRLWQAGIVLLWLVATGLLVQREFGGPRTAALGPSR